MRRPQMARKSVLDEHRKRRKELMASQLASGELRIHNLRDLSPEDRRRLEKRVGPLR